MTALAMSPARTAVPADPAELIRLRAAFTERPPLSSRLPVSYQHLPSWMRSAAARALGGWRRSKLTREMFPAWPLDLSADEISDAAGGAPSPFSGRPTPVVLTHDLDSPEGLSNLLRWFTGIEESVGARSTSFIVPCAWPIDHGLLDELRARGHGLGIHGYDHSNRTAFLPEAQIRQRLQGARPLIDRHGISGYRAPSLLRTRRLLACLAELYRYDSSIPTSGGLFPVPGNGCASARPFVVEGITELPLSLPRDGSLRFLGHEPSEIVKLWIDCAKRISRSGGVVVLLTHCEARFSGNAAMREAYRAFVEHIAADPRYSWSTPESVLEGVLEGQG